MNCWSYIHIMLISCILCVWVQLPYVFFLPVLQLCKEHKNVLYSFFFCSVFTVHISLYSWLYYKTFMYKRFDVFKNEITFSGGEGCVHRQNFARRFFSSFIHCIFGLSRFFVKHCIIENRRAIVVYVYSSMQY